MARLHRLPLDRVRAILVRLRLGEHLLDRLPSQISGGEMQRFALARVLLLDPVFLFADEATSRLDPASQKEVVDLLIEIVAETGLGLLLVTHDRALAARVANRTIALDQHQLPSDPIVATPNSAFTFPNRTRTAQLAKFA